MNSAQRTALRQKLTELGFERSGYTPPPLKDSQPGEYDESWISDNADEVEIRWAART